MPRSLARTALVVFAAALVLLLAFTTAASAQQVRLGGKVRAGNRVVVPRGETVPGDLIVAGGTIRIEGTVNGDVVAAGGTVDVTGRVGGEVLVTGGQVRVPGQVDGAVRVVAGQVSVEGTVGKDLLLGAGQATVTSTGRIGGDFIFSAGSVTLEGAVAGNVLGYAGSYTRTGTVGGTQEVTIAQPKQKHVPSAADRMLGIVRNYVAVLAMGALFLWLLPKLFLGSEWRARGRALPSLGIGIVGIIATGVLLATVLFVGIALAIPLGLLRFGSLIATVIMAVIVLWMVVGFLLYLIAAFGAPAVVGTVLGNLILGPRTTPATKRPFAALALGVLIVVLLMAIPVLGGVVGALVFLFGFGAILLWIWQQWRPPRAADAALAGGPAQSAQLGEPAPPTAPGQSVQPGEPAQPGEPG